MLHPTAVIERGAQLGDAVSVGPFSYVAAGVTIGDRCVLGPHVTVLTGTTLGAGCRVHAGAVVGDLPQDLSFKPCDSAVTIGERCTIREGVTVHRGAKPGTITVIGNDCLLMANAHVAHDALLGNRIILANGALIGGFVHIDDRAFVSGNVAVHQFVSIGRVAMLGGGGAVSRDVPPFCTTRPVTVNRILGLNVVGLRRAGYDALAREEIKRAFKLVYQSTLTYPEAAEAIRREFPAASPALEFARFIETSRRGLSSFREGDSPLTS